MTPEGRIKRKISELLRSYGVYYFMPVQSGLGSTTLDYLCCVGGSFVGIEAKREGKEPTPRQETVMENIVNSNGQVFVVSNDDGLKFLEEFLKNNTKPRK